jgi:hypothetical protein
MGNDDYQMRAIGAEGGFCDTRYNGVATASISADGGHVVSVDRNKTAKIWRLFQEENVRCESFKKKMKLS